MPPTNLSCSIWCNAFVRNIILSIITYMCTHAKQAFRIWHNALVSIINISDNPCVCNGMRDQIDRCKSRLHRRGGCCTSGSVGDLYCCGYGTGGGAEENSNKGNLKPFEAAERAIVVSDNRLRS